MLRKFIYGEWVGAFGKEPGDGLAEKRVDEVGHDFVEGCEYETAFCNPGMRQCEDWGVDNFGIAK